MAETMLQIFQRHRDCFDFTKEPNWQESDEARQLCNDRQREREQAANEYVSNILASNDNWAKDIDEDTSKLALSFQRILNNAEREVYSKATEQFLLYVAKTLREHRVKQLSPVTRYRMGRIEFRAMNVVTGLSVDEAKREFQKMKEQGFTHVQTFPTDAFPAVYTAFGYKPKASTPAQAQKKADSSATDTGMSNNATTPPQTPPATQETPQFSILPPYKPEPKGRKAGLFAKTIADPYKDKADIIQEHTKTALANMTDPKAVIALFIVYFRNGILKQCPTYWEALRLLGIEADTDREKAKHCPFGSYQGYDRVRPLYFAIGNRSLNETIIEQDNDISSFIKAANSTYTALLAKLNQTHEEQARQGA